MKYHAVHVGLLVVRRPPRGGRGLKFGTVDHLLEGDGRPPRGGRGLKSNYPFFRLYFDKSPPLAGGVD